MGDWRPQIAASILTADFGHLDRVVRKLERAGVDRLHLDVMDGHFVPNITFGPDVVAAFRRLTSLPLDVHLMIDHPARFLERFLAAGPDTVTFHVEADRSADRVARALATIRDAEVGAGLAVSPQTPTRAVEPYMEWLDVIMIMTVEPGFGGQRFMTDAAPKLTEAAGFFAASGTSGDVHVDGGVNRDTASLVGAWGADVCIVGSALFQRGRDTAEEVRVMRERAWEGRHLGPRQIEPEATATDREVAAVAAPRAR